MIGISDHARKAMDDDGISEEEVRWCMEHGEKEIKELVNSEMRYGKRLELKDKTIMVIYVQRGEITHVVTCYTIRKKKWQNQ